MAKTMLAISLLVGAGACSTPARQTSGPAVVPTSAGPEPSTTEAPTTVPEPTTTTSMVPEPVEDVPATTRTTRARSAPTTTVYEPPSPQSRTVGGEDNSFWYRLATCESGNGAGSSNQFQFMGGTDEKVGYYDGASYEAQRAMAQDWADRLRAEGRSPGSSAGWPVCWWTAGGS
jgi:hypothetical protein